MPDNRTILEYRGEVTFITIDRLAVELKALEEFRLLKKGVQKRLYGIIVECLENIYRYQAGGTDLDRERQPYISIAVRDGRFTVSTGNLMENSQSAALRSRLDKINAQDHNELKHSYRHAISRGTPTDKGAGLGLLTIALQSRSSLDYSFKPVDESRSYFELNLVLATGDSPG
jgi:hypothetical protein